jgi:hypothetical protein
MAKSNTSANDYVALVYNATAIANIADNAATSPLTNIFIAAHTADPGAAGTQSTSEAAYTGYARASVARTTGGFTCSNGTVTLVANASFGACTAGTATLTHWSTGVASSGATKVLHRGVFGSRLGPFTGATSNTITIPGTTLAVDDRIAFYATSGSSLPTGLTEGTVYFVKTASGADITVATTSGGAAVTITVAGDGLAYKVTPIAVSSGVTPQLAAGAIIYEE